MPKIGVGDDTLFPIKSEKGSRRVSPLNAKLTRFLSSPWQDKVNGLSSVFAKLKTGIYYRRIFGAVGRGSVIYKPLLIVNPQFVYIGERTCIRPGARIEAVVVDPGQPPSLLIGDNVNIEQNVHLVCSSRLEIENNVSVTGNCAIVDTKHPYRDVHDPRKIGDRIDPNRTPVTVGEGSFLGFGCVVLPGVRIGRNCVIGANSVVRKDIPDWCVVSGNPAEIVSRYDATKREWR